MAKTKSIKPAVTGLASSVAQTIATPAADVVTNAKPAVAVKPNARAHLRALFDTVGKVVTKDDVYGIKKDEEGNVLDKGYYNVTINTHLTDLKNPTYAGKLGTISIVNMKDGTFKRVA
jgi:hypothetical protein